MHRKFMVLLAPALVLSLSAAPDEDDGPIPQTPTAFETRNTGRTTEESAVIRREEGKTRKITYSTVTVSREWRDTKGTVIRARMLAFEAAPGQAQPVVKDGKVRLLVEGKTRFNLLPLARLSHEDQEFVKTLIATRAKASASPETADDSQEPGKSDERPAVVDP